MFEEELELEKKSSSWGPLILVIVFVGCIVGGIGYYVFELKKGLSEADATAIVERILKANPPHVAFRSGKVEASGAEQPKDPHYKVFEKAGFVTVKDVNSSTNVVTVTDAGEKAFAGISGFTKKKNADDTVTYEMPLASRKLVKIDSVTINRPGDATVVYEWQWVPNQIGDLFDLNGDNLKPYSTWERQKLIDKYGADFYNSATKKETIHLTKGDKDWGIGND